MVKKTLFLNVWYLSFLLVSQAVFGQVEVCKTDFELGDFQNPKRTLSFLISENTVLFTATSNKLYALDKVGLKPIWEIDLGCESSAFAYRYKNSVLLEYCENGRSSVGQYDMNTGVEIKKLPFEAIKSKPYFLNDVMYCTVLADGGKLVAYDLNGNKILWQKNIGFGTDFQPVYLNDKIIANAEDDNWFEIDYTGTILKRKSQQQIYIDSTAFFVKNYLFPTHDGEELSIKFLMKNKLVQGEFQIKTSNTHSFICSEGQLVVLGNNRKSVLELDLEKVISSADSEDAYKVDIVETHPESVWFCYQNYLLHYDLTNKNLLRKIDLTKWRPGQVAIDKRTIWLISKNDGQLYGLDFEPDHKTAAMMAAKVSMQSYLDCTKPDPKKIEAIKAAQKKFETN